MSDKESRTVMEIIVRDIFVGLIVAVAGGVIVSIIVGEGRFSLQMNRETPIVITKSNDTSPLVTTTPMMTMTPSPTISSSPFNKLVFSDDLNNGNQNFILGGGSGSIKVVSEETGNKVLELSDAGSNSLLATFGPKNISNFAIEYRVKNVSLDKKSYESGIANLFLRYTEFGGPIYVLSLDPYNQYILFYHYPPFDKIDGTTIKVITGKWYDIRVEMDGENLFASVDGVPVIKTTDSRLNSGSLGFQIYSNTITDFDDVKVWTRQ